MTDLVPSPPAPSGQFLLYQTEDGRTRLEVRLDAETVWLSLNQMAELFQRDSRSFRCTSRTCSTRGN